MSISIAIVEDETRVRVQLAKIINEAPGFRCQGAFGSGEEALREISRQPIDVVLMDINLPKNVWRRMHLPAQETAAAAANHHAHGL